MTRDWPTKTPLHQAAIARTAVDALLHFPSQCSQFQIIVRPSWEALCLSGPQQKVPCKVWQTNTDRHFHVFSVAALTSSLLLLVHLNMVSLPAVPFSASKKQTLLKITRGDILHEGGTGHPSMSYLSHFSAFPKVREIEMTFPSILLFLSVLVLTTRCANSISPT